MQLTRHWNKSTKLLECENISKADRNKTNKTLYIHYVTLFSVKTRPWWRLIHVGNVRRVTYENTRVGRASRTRRHMRYIILQTLFWRKDSDIKNSPFDVKNILVCLIWFINFCLLSVFWSEVHRKPLDKVGEVACLSPGSKGFPNFLTIFNRQLLNTLSLFLAVISIWNGKNNKNDGHTTL